MLLGSDALVARVLGDGLDRDATQRYYCVDVDRLLELEPAFGDFADRRAAQKEKFGCEFFPSSFTADLVGNTFLGFFQIDKETEAQKGIIALDL